MPKIGFGRAGIDECEVDGAHMRERGRDESDVREARWEVGRVARGVPVPMQLHARSAVREGEDPRVHGVHGWAKWTL